MKALVVTIGCVALFSSALMAFAPADRNVVQPELPFTLDPGIHQSNSVVVKFVDTTTVRLVNGALVDIAGVADLDPYTSLLAGSQVARLFERPVESLDLERAALLHRIPQGLPDPADLNNYFRVTTSGAAASEQLINALNPMGLVEVAYAEPSLASLRPSGDIAPETTLFDCLQTYKREAPIGIGFDELRNIVGGRAPDLNIGHIGMSWEFGHEDISQLLPERVIGSQPAASWSTWKDHDNAVVGLMMADRNKYGVRGMSDGGHLMLGSIDSAGAANQISQMTAASSAGDVWVSSFSWVIAGGFDAPVDYYQAEFDAVYAASLKGVVYCVAAGNTNSDLTDPVIYGSRYAAGAADSGAVIVGATRSTNLDKLPSSNHGARVDSNAWGDSVATTGYGDIFDPNDPKQRYTEKFSRTSAATPQVAGVAAAISNIVREQNGMQLTSFQIRDLLRTHGTPQGAGGAVGLRADLKAALAAVGLPDGLRTRDDAVTGKPVDITINAHPGMPMFLFISPGRAQVDVGLNRNFLLDPSALYSVGGSVMGTSGLVKLTGMVPDQPALIGLSMYLQVADGMPGGAWHLSNSVELWVRE